MKFEGFVHGVNRVVSAGKIQASNDQITLPFHSSFIQTSFHLILDLIGMPHGPVHTHARVPFTLPNLEAISSVQITLTFCYK